jgi:hypothetical protein
MHGIIRALSQRGSNRFSASTTTTSAAMNSLDATLTEFGADLEALHRFDDETKGPDLLPYATLLSAHKAGDEQMAPLLGIYEWQDSPLMYLVAADLLQDDEHLRKIRRQLALRGDAPYLGVVRPGQLVVYQLAVDDCPLADVQLPGLSTSHAFAYLANERPNVFTDRRRWISGILLRLLDQSITDLIKQGEVAHEDAISLVGRTLFTRFLGDRDLVPATLFSDGLGVAELFDNAERAAATSQWLDTTFNGEFLPFSEGLFEKLPPAAFHTLGNVLRRADSGQLYLEWEEDWAHLDFAHIPVGVLSQSYEQYLREHLPEKQKKEGGYYTPRAIAQLLVDAAFAELRRQGIAHEARVLDPAAGAGVFLLTAFRELVAERWRHDAKRPDTATLREILYGQITGFDINESALRFAALGLYLLSIELDPEPEPVEKLRFDDLREREVLRKVGSEGELGSLGAGVGDEHIGRYDLVVGNPPWASSIGLGDWDEVAKHVAGIAEARVPGSSRLRLLPNQPLDLPFVWRAMEWAKPDGQIAFALHARLLFQQHEGMPEARSAIFRAMDVTGVLNGAELAQTNVWPEISAPFCLIWARNRVPPPGTAFRFVSPHLEDSLNRSGNLRIDVSNADWVTAEQIAQVPTILKTLFRGGPLDLEIYERGFARNLPTLRKFWQESFGEVRGKPNYTGNGYQRVRPSSRTRKNGDGKPGVSTEYLFEALCEESLECDLPELTPEAMKSVLVNREDLGRFDQARLHDPRDPEIFRGPLLLVHQSPPAGAERIPVAIAEMDLVFNETYYGYSATRHPDGKLLVRYLALLISSKLALWHALMTSGKFGFERRVVEKATIDSIPVIPFDDLGTDMRNEVDVLFDGVVSGDNEQNWSRVDEWVARLYGLLESDLQVIEDTLHFDLPYAANWEAAQSPPQHAQTATFCETLAASFAPWAEKGGIRVDVRPQSLPAISPWQLVRVQTRQPGTPESAAALDWTAVLNVADHLGATEVLYPDEQTDCLWVARLAQARYWSQSQARLLARRIVWEHVDFLLGAQRA